MEEKEMTRARGKGYVVVCICQDSSASAEKDCHQPPCLVVTFCYKCLRFLKSFSSPPKKQ